MADINGFVKIDKCTLKNMVGGCYATIKKKKEQEISDYFNNMKDMYFTQNIIEKLFNVKKKPKTSSELWDIFNKIETDKNMFSMTCVEKVDFRYSDYIGILNELKQSLDQDEILISTKTMSFLKRWS